jgi:uncharacterized protein YndB with AHSA1/START domain
MGDLASLANRASVSYVGTQTAMRGVYREVVPPERIVRAESFELGCDAQVGEQVATVVLTEQGGKTLLTLTVLFSSKEARDATIASGMERGAAASTTGLRTCCRRSHDNLFLHYIEGGRR